ncbi:uncharacterized protein LOC129588843 isoform X2 [Paramacrobiotus metropolitanus]|nr:uncharacterized protein LOC129588843 isoform X2 [Paramacrobiotus metropolitanus]
MRCRRVTNCCITSDWIIYRNLLVFLMMPFRLCLLIAATCLPLVVVGTQSEPCSTTWQKCGQLQNETYGLPKSTPFVSWDMRQANANNTEQASSHCRPAAALASCLASVLQRCPDDPKVQRYAANGGWYDAETWLLESRICNLSLHAVGFNLALEHCGKQLPESQQSLLYVDDNALAQASNNASMARHNM